MSENLKSFDYLKIYAPEPKHEHRQASAWNNPEKPPERGVLGDKTEVTFASLRFLAEPVLLNEQDILQAERPPRHRKTPRTPQFNEI